ncbi:membrane-associated zinc metalloprotease, partial [mine drainage metagenome]
RVLTIAAGPVMNILLGIVLFWALNSIVGLPQVASGPPRIAALERGMPAFQAGLRPGDELLAANGHRIGNWNTLLHVVSGADGRPIDFTVLRNGHEFRVAVAPKPDPNAGGVMHIGVIPTQVNVPQPLFAGFGHGIAQTFSVIGLLFSAVGGAIARGQAPPVSGIVGIYGAVQQAAAAGIA